MEAERETTNAYLHSDNGEFCAIIPRSDVGARSFLFENSNEGLWNRDKLCVCVCVRRDTCAAVRCL